MTAKPPNPCVAGFSSGVQRCLLRGGWQPSEAAGRETLRKCLRPLLTALPAHSGSLITEAFAYCPCFAPHASSMMLLHSHSVCGAEGITAAAVAEVRAQMWPSSGLPGCAREPETLYIKDNYRSPFFASLVPHSVWSFTWFLKEPLGLSVFR